MNVLMTINYPTHRMRFALTLARRHKPVGMRLSRTLKVVLV